MNLHKDFKLRCTSGYHQYNKWYKQSKETSKRILNEFGELFPPELCEFLEQLDEFEYVQIYWAGTVLSGADLYIYIPWQPKLCDDIVLAFQSAGWRIYLEYAGKFDVMPTYTFNLKNEIDSSVNVYVKMDSDSAASTCRLVQTGTEIVEKPIWEVRCSESDEI
jgi:hypothetical protein